MKSVKTKSKYRSPLEDKAVAKTQSQPTTWIGGRLFTVILVAALVVGVCLLVYPSFADYWNSIHQTHAVMSYAENVSNMGEEEYQRILDEARIYNAELAKTGMNWGMTDEQKQAYQNQLEIGGNGVMGYIKIQKIDIMLPIS